MFRILEGQFKCLKFVKYKNYFYKKVIRISMYDISRIAYMF